ncbi:MAG: hypothetical protein JNM31_11800 [Flavobacteriales bacterium]|nr:hypothetical protein [Flavobacteriales bacterium]
MRLLHPTTEETGTSVLFVHGQPQGFRLRPNARAICTRTLDRDTIYSVTCTIDSTGGRKTRQPKVYSERTVVFLGCSFTFGTGVDDDQTLPAWYAQIDTSARVLNRAVPGYGPQNWWLQFKEKEMAPLIHSDSVLFILPIIDGHLARAVGSMQVYSTWGENLPYCRLEDDQIAQYGTFTTGRPFTSTLYWMLYKSPVVRFLGIDLPATRSEGSLKLMKALLEGTARMAREQHPRSRFLVLLYPGMTTAPYFVEHLDREWLEVFDLSTMSWQNEHRIPHDPHPSATGHARVARSIAGHVHHQQPIVGGYVP